MLGKVLRTMSLVLLAGLAAAETIPAGAHITVRIDSAISSGTARTGQAFHGNLTRNLVRKRQDHRPGRRPGSGKSHLRQEQRTSA